MGKSDTLMSAGEVALLLRKNPRTIARWAEMGLLGEVAWTEGGHRRFSRETIETLHSTETTKQAS